MHPATQAIYTDVTDGSDILHYTEDEDAKALIAVHIALDDAAFVGEPKTQFKVDRFEPASEFEQRNHVKHYGTVSANN